MTENFFEIQNGYFTASEKNKVNNVNLVIEKQGEIVSLLGPSGIGKTTILRTIAIRSFFTKINIINNIIIWKKRIILKGKCNISFLWLNMYLI